jgi:hypothetical protein
MKSARNKDGEVAEEHALFSGQFNDKCRNSEQNGHNHFSAKFVQRTMMQITVIRLQEIIALTAIRRVISSLTV